MELIAAPAASTSAWKPEGAVDSVFIGDLRLTRNVNRSRNDAGLSLWFFEAVIRSKLRRAEVVLKRHRGGVAAIAVTALGFEAVADEARELPAPVGSGVAQADADTGVERVTLASAISSLRDSVVILHSRVTICWKTLWAI